MRRRNSGDHGDVRADHAGECSDLSAVVHAHFEHAELGIARHPGEAEGHAGVVIIAFDRSVDFAGAVPVERGGDGLL